MARSPDRATRRPSRRRLAFEKLEDRQLLSVGPEGPEFRVNTFTMGTQAFPGVALDADGDFVITWASNGQDGSSYGVYAQRYNAAGVAQGGEFQVNSFTTGNQFRPAVAMDLDGDFVVTWDSNGQDGSGYGVYAQRYNAAGVAQGGEFRVNTFTTGAQSRPAVAMDSDGDFVITWHSFQDGAGYGIYAQRYNAAGVAQGGEFQVNTFTTSQQRFPAVAMDAGGDFVITWQSYGQDGSGYGVYAQRYNAAGLIQGGEFQVNTFTTSFQRFHAVAMDLDGDFVITWESLSQDGSSYGVYAQRYNAAGVAQGGEFQVNTYTTSFQSNPAVAMDADGDFVITWQSYVQEGAASGLGVYAQRYNAAGVAQGGEFRVNTFTTSAQSRPAVAMDSDGDFVITWYSNGQDGSGYGVYAQRYAGSPDTAGPMVTGVFVAGDSHLIQQGERLVTTVPQLVVAFSEDLSLLEGSSGAGSVLNPANWQLTHNGVDVTSRIIDITFGNNAVSNRYQATLTFDSPLTAGTYVLTATDAIGDRCGNPLDGDFDGRPGRDFQHAFSIQPPVPLGGEFQVHTFTTNNQEFAAVAMDADGDFVITWTSYAQEGVGSGFGVYARRYNAAGVAQGAEFQVNTFTTGNQRFPAVAMDADGDFVITWESFAQDGSSAGVYAQRYNAAGVAQGGEFQVNTFTTGAQSRPAVAMDSDGDFVITWNSNGQDGSGYGVYARRYNAAGLAQGGEFQVNTFTTSQQRFPAVAMDAGGDFVITWHSDAQDGSFYGVYAQRYNAAGVAQGGEFQVNTFTTFNQSSPAVAMDADGDFVVGWESYAQDGSGNGVYAQRYNAEGLAQGGEFQVNTFTTSFQRLHAVAMDLDGDFVITWQSYGQDGSGYGVYAQRYNAAGLAQGGEFLVNTFTTSSQRDPAVAIDADGDFVIAWRSFGQDGSSYGVYAQRYGANQPPVALDDAAGTDEDLAALIDLLANDTDADGTLDPASVSITSGPANGTAVSNGDGTVTYTPTPDFNGSDSFVYQVCDAALACDTASVTVTVNPLPDAPLAADDAATTSEDTAVTVNVLANDTDADGDALVVTSATAPSHGSVLVNPDHTITYTPLSNFNGSDSFTYTASDGSASDTATVTITINPVNDNPNAVGDTATTSEDTAVTVSVLANDTDPEGNLLSVTAAGPAAHGTVVVSADNTVTYTPNAGFSGSDLFSYTISDGQGGSDTATVTITVNAVPDQLVVTLLTPTSSGFTAQFNRALDMSVLNLYDTQSGGLGAADATLVGASVGPVKGSLVIDPSLMKITFLATGGLFTSIAADGALPADTYTVTLRSAANGFKDTSGNLLDGNADDVPGDSYVNNFTISSVAAVQVGVPDIARGPGQPVHVPATATGIPIRLSNGSGVDSVDLTLTYDPALLNVTDMVLGVSMPSDASLVFNLTTPGRVLVSLSTVSTPLGAGPIDLVTLTATVPCTAAYKSVHVLDVTQVSVNEGLIAARDDDGVHAVAYFGDSTGNGGYSGLDGQRVQRVVVALDSGFLAYPLLDPVVISDITGNGSLSGLDSTRIQQEVVGIDRPEIPPIPVCSSPSAAVPSAPQFSSAGIGVGGTAGALRSAGVADTSSASIGSALAEETFLENGPPAIASRASDLQHSSARTPPILRLPPAPPTSGTDTRNALRQGSAAWQQLPQAQTSPGVQTALAHSHRAYARALNPAPPPLPTTLPGTALHQDLEDLIVLLASDQSR